jgi:hypothetical protein
MIIAFDNVFFLDAEDDSPALHVHAAGTIAVSLDAADFEVKHRHGKTSVCLTRHLTDEQARALGQALIARADENDARRKWSEAASITYSTMDDKAQP